MWLLLLLALALEPWSTPASVPGGVRYQAADEATNEAAAKLLSSVLAGGSEPLFGKVVAVGPFLWAELKDRLPGDTPLAYPQYGVEGQIFRQTEGLTAELRKLLPTFTLRRPTREELALYWDLIPYDIVEPIFVAEGPGHKILLHFHRGQVFAIDDYQDPSTARLDRMEAEGPPWPLVTDYKQRFQAYKEGVPAQASPKDPFTTVVLTPDAALRRRMALPQLQEYLKQLQGAVQTTKFQGPLDVVAQLELDPGRPLHLVLEPESEPLRQALSAVSPPPVRGRVVFQLLLRINGGTGKPLGP